jgi:hypothetical protein
MRGIERSPGRGARQPPQGHHRPAWPARQPYGLAEQVHPVLTVPLSPGGRSGSPLPPDGDEPLNHPLHFSHHMHTAPANALRNFAGRESHDSESSLPEPVTRSAPLARHCPSQERPGRKVSRLSALSPLLDLRPLPQARPDPQRWSAKSTSMFRNTCTANQPRMAKRVTRYTSQVSTCIAHRRAGRQPPRGSGGR